MIPPNYRSLNLPGQISLLRTGSLEAIEKALQNALLFKALILDSWDHDHASGLSIHRFGFLTPAAAGQRRTLYPTHNEGLCSCINTIICTLLEIQQRGESLPGVIDMSFGMQSFNQNLAADFYHLFYAAPTPAALATMESTEIAAGFQSLPDQPNKFNHHGDYQALIHKTLGLRWCRAYADAYCRPTQRLQARVDFFAQQYALTKLRTLVACYRGTDKQLEHAADPLDAYIEKAKQLVEQHNLEQVIIQTDQEQVRRVFSDNFGATCRYIKELPATHGSTVLHYALSAEYDREAWTLDLLAMIEACSDTAVVLTHTGNVGLQLALHAAVKGRSFVQLN